MELITIVTIINSVVLLLAIGVFHKRSIDSVDRDIEVLDTAMKGSEMVLELVDKLNKRAFVKINEKTGAIQSKFDKQNNDMKKDVTAIKFATKLVLKQIDERFDRVDKQIIVVTKKTKKTDKKN